MSLTSSASSSPSKSLSTEASHTATNSRSFSATTFPSSDASATPTVSGSREGSVTFSKSFTQSHGASDSWSASATPSSETSDTSSLSAAPSDSPSSSYSPSLSGTVTVAVTGTKEKRTYSRVTRGTASVTQYTPSVDPSASRTASSTLGTVTPSPTRARTPTHPPSATKTVFYSLSESATEAWSPSTTLSESPVATSSDSDEFSQSATLILHATVTIGESATHVHSHSHTVVPTSTYNKSISVKVSETQTVYLTTTRDPTHTGGVPSASRSVTTTVTFGRLTTSCSSSASRTRSSSATVTPDATVSDSDETSRTVTLMATMTQTLAATPSHSDTATITDRHGLNQTVTHSVAASQTHKASMSDTIVFSASHHATSRTVTIGKSETKEITGSSTVVGTFSRTVIPSTTRTIEESFTVTLTDWTGTRRRNSSTPSATHSHSGVPLVRPTDPNNLYLSALAGVALSSLSAQQVRDVVTSSCFKNSGMILGVVVAIALIPLIVAGLLALVHLAHRRVTGKPKAQSIDVEMEPTLIRAALAHHVYTGAIFACRWQCVPLHVLRLLVHIGLLLVTALGCYAYFAGDAATEATDASTIPIVLSLVIACFISIPLDWVVQRLMYHHREEEQSFDLQKPTTPPSEVASLFVSTFGKDDPLSKPSHAADVSVEVRWDALGEAAKSSAMAFVAGGVDVGNEEGDAVAEQVVGRVVVLDHLMTDVDAAEADAWAEGDDISVVVDDEEHSLAIEIHVTGSGSTPDEGITEAHNAHSQEASGGSQGASQIAATLQHVARIRVVVTPYRGGTIAAVIGTLIASMVSLFMITLELESKNRGAAACGRGPSSASLPLLFIVLIADVCLQCVVVIVAHGFFVVTDDSDIIAADGTIEFDDEERRRYGTDLEFASVSVNDGAHPHGRKTCFGRCLQSTHHGFPFHPLPGQQSLVLQRANTTTMPDVES
jgi:hypothetical protein